MQLRYMGPTPETAIPGALVTTVLGRTPAGQTILDTAVGRLALNLPTGVANLDAGQRLAFEILSVGRQGAQVASTATPTAALGRAWPALKETMAALASLDAPLARQILDVSLPRPAHPRFLAQLLSQLAFPAQDARALLGETALASLDRGGRHDLIARLDADLREMNRINSSSADWRLFFIPIFDAPELRQLRVFTRKRKPQDKDREQGGRFVVEVDFDDLGPLQVDGLVQKPRIDVIVRSHAALSRELQAGILNVFQDTCGAAGLVGQLFFQAVPTFPVSPLEDIAKAAPGGVSI